MFNEENLKPSLKFIQKSKAGIFTTFTLLLISVVIGAFISIYFGGHGSTLTIPKLSEILFLILPLGTILTTTFLIHLPLKKAVFYTILSTIAVFILNLIYYFSPYYGPQETPFIYISIILIPIIIFALISIGMICRLLINKLGSLGYFVCCFLALLLTVIMTA